MLPSDNRISCKLQSILLCTSLHQDPQRSFCEETRTEKLSQHGRCWFYLLSSFISNETKQIGDYNLPLNRSGSWISLGLLLSSTDCDTNTGMWQGFESLQLCCVLGHLSPPCWCPSETSLSETDNSNTRLIWVLEILHVFSLVTTTGQQHCCQK